MALYKSSIDFLPKLSKEEVQEKYKVSKAGVYAAILPLLASFIWLVSVFISYYYDNESKQLDSTIQEKENEIASYNSTRGKQSELVLKVDALSDIVERDFYPQKFFNDVSQTIQSTGDAEATIYSYGRKEEGEFNISGKANSYLDLAKIMVVFNSKEEFSKVTIDSISYNKDEDNVNFEISFTYAEEQEASEAAS